MRIQEVIAEDVNPDIRNPEFEHEQQIGDFLYTARTKVSPSGLTTYLLIRCRNGNDLIGKADFEMRVNAGRKWLESLNTQVLPEYQSQGIASTMYAYAKMLGNDIKPSRDQSDQGKAMWKGWQKSGAAKHLLPQVAEAVGGNYLYHGVPNGRTVANILKSGAIEPQEQFEQDCDDPTDHKLCPPVISLSRDQYLRFPYGNAVAQFVIDKDAIKRAGIVAKPQAGAGYFKAESEERVYKPIPVRAPYVVAIQYDPKLKIPKSVLDYAQQQGIKIVPWGQTPVSKTANADAPKTIPPAREYTNPNALKLKKQDWRGDVDWTITYDTGGGRSNIIQPYYMVKDENTVKAAYNAIKDRISKGLSFDDLLPQSQYGKNWSKGAYEIKPGDPKYKAQSA